MQHLIQTLENKIQALHQAFEPRLKETLYRRFDRHLFTEDFQTPEFYFKEIGQTLAQLKTLSATELAQWDFMTQKLISQCNALTDALRPQYASSTATQPKAAPARPSKSAHPVHKLPPRERLEKYYDALRELNEKIDECRDAAASAMDENMRELALKQKAQYKARRAKCLEAIELLEEYLAFKEGTEKGEEG